MSNAGVGWRKISIRTRILLLVLSLIAAIFIMVLAAFNLLVEEYIRGSVREQLQNFRQMTHNRMTPPPYPPPSEFDFAPDMRGLPRDPMDRAEVLVISDNYQLLFPNANMIFIRNFADIQALAARLRQEQVHLENSEITRIGVSGREYYFVSTPMPRDRSTEKSYLIYYIDMTAIKSFAGRINIVLVAVMGIAGLLAVALALLLSGLIARPIRELTDFAARMGRGDFYPNPFNYGDAELAELALIMNKSAAQLGTYDREQKQFFQNVSHELRTPLQVIRSHAEGIEQRILDARTSSRIIIGESDRLGEMVEDLLYLSRMDTLTTDSKIETRDLRELLSHSAQRQGNLAAKRGIGFVFDFDQNPVYMDCQEKHLSRALANLISNAIRYAQTSITLTCHRLGSRIIITVADDGAGISDEDLPHIFDRFYKGRGGGHGIGLSIAQSVIRQHQGQIKAQNTDGGTLFTISFAHKAVNN